MKLPRMQGGRKTERQVVEFRGLDLTESRAEGTLQDCIGLTSDRYPALAQRTDRVSVAAGAGVTDFYVWDGEMYTVKGTGLYRGDVKIADVTEGKKQFAVVNTKLVVFPDKLCYDAEEEQVKPLGVRLQRKESGGVWVYDAQDSSIRCRSMTEELRAIKPGDVVHVTARYVIGYGYSDEKWFNSDMDVAVKSVEGEIIRFAGDLFPDMTEGERRDESGRLSTTVIERVIPDLDFICESENRLWGCCNADKTIYASALGDPTNFFVYAGVSTDSYAVAVGSDGPFTAICRHAGAVCVWKERRLVRVLGSYPAEYYTQEYGVDGVQAGSERSMAAINEVLYFQGADGVYAYSGNLPSKISRPLGLSLLRGGVGGRHREKYYLSTEMDGRWVLLVYDTAKGLWIKEAERRVDAMGSIGGELYLLKSDHTMERTADSRDELLEWMAQFNPFDETTHRRKGHTFLRLRLDMSDGAWVRVEIKEDRGPWKLAWSQSCTKEMTVNIPLRIGRCDSFAVRLSGRGHTELHSMVREFILYSER